MKILLSIVLGLVLSISEGFAQLQTYILVRHAEKESSMLANPDLTKEGLTTSQNLAQMLSHLEIKAVYSTPYTRTEKTVSPLAKSRGLDINFYQPNLGNEMIDNLINEGKSEKENSTYVISGHSNTIPALVNYLMQKEIVPPMPETDYGKVFVVTISPTNERSLLLLQIPKSQVTDSQP